MKWTTLSTLRVKLDNKCRRGQFLLVKRLLSQLDVKISKECRCGQFSAVPGRRAASIASSPCPLPPLRRSRPTLFLLKLNI